MYIDSKTTNLYNNNIKNEKEGKQMKNVKIVEAVTHTHTHTHTNRKEEGITLIALIITVIILLILAGVAINFALRRQWNTKRSRNCSR